MSHWDFGYSSADDDYPPRSDDDAERSEEWDDDLAPYPLTFERDPGYPGASAPEPGADAAPGVGSAARRAPAPPLPWERDRGPRSPRFTAHGRPQAAAGPAAGAAAGVDDFAAGRDGSRFTADPGTNQFTADPDGYLFRADPDANRFAADPGTERFTDAPDAGMFAADPGAGQFADDPDAGQFADDPAGPGTGPDEWADWYGGGRRRRGPGRNRGLGQGGRRWVIPAVLAVAAAALGAGAVVITAGHPDAAAGPGARRSQPAPGTQSGAGTRAAQGSAGSRSASPAATGSPASSAAGASTPAAQGAGTAGTGSLTMAQAQAVLASYTAANNEANAQRSDTRLATIETGSSYALDAALYQAGQAAGTATYPAFGPVSATYFLPRDEPSAGPRWFVVRVANAFTASPAKVNSTEYLLFTEQTAGGPWLDTIEPYLLSGASAPAIEVGADGLATAVSPGSAAQAVAPGQLPAVTAGSLDGTVTGPAAVADPGNLADEGDQRLWRKDVPNVNIAASHAPASGVNGPEFALATSDGGALVFYTDAASLTITPPAGSVLHVTIPGLYSPSQSVTRAGISYLEQFAAYDPPAGGGAPRIVADYSAITGKD